MTTKLLTCCVCEQPIEKGQSAFFRLRQSPESGGPSVNKAWHPKCGPIDMIIDDRVFD